MPEIILKINHDLSTIGISAEVQRHSANDHGAKRCHLGGAVCKVG